MSRIIRLDPPSGVDAVVIGSTRDAARAALARYGDVRAFSRAGEEPGWCATAEAGALTIFAYVDAGGVVDAIEIARPTDGSVVLFGDVDVFGVPAEEVIARLRHDHPVTEEDGGGSYVIDNLLLAFWRAVVPEPPDNTRTTESAWR